MEKIVLEEKGPERNADPTACQKGFGDSDESTFTEVEVVGIGPRWAEK